MLPIANELVAHVEVAMYKISCTRCGRIGFHPSRVAAESRAERHEAETDHGVSVAVMDED